MLAVVPWVHFILRKLAARGAPHDCHTTFIQTPKAEDSIFQLDGNINFSSHDDGFLHALSLSITTEYPVHLAGLIRRPNQLIANI